jgi:Glycosyl hydrolase family 20, domain 2
MLCLIFQKFTDGVFSVSCRMKKILTVIYVSLLTTPLFSQSMETPISIIPEPVTLSRMQGHFSLPANLVIITDNEKDLKQSIEFLKLRFSSAAGIAVTVAATSSSPSVTLKLNKKPEDPLGTEGYHLTVTPSAITLMANKPAGISRIPGKRRTGKRCHMAGARCGDHRLSAIRMERIDV